MTDLRPFLNYVFERQQIADFRRGGALPPWSADPIFQTRKFCCVIRDDDRTSREARAIITTLPSRKLGVTLGFRLYNRVSTLEALLAADAWDRDSVLRTLQALPLVFNTQAYRVTVKGGLWSLEGVATILAKAARQVLWEPRDVAQYTTEMIQSLLGIGPFLAYQVVQDLRWLGYRYTDEDTWCLVGGGALRGLERLVSSYSTEKHSYRGGTRFDHNTVSEKDQAAAQREYSPLMRQLLTESQRIVPAMNMFEVEHNLCEFDKYERVRSGETPGLRWKPREQG